MKKICVLLGVLTTGQAYAQNYETGRNGWQLERLSSNFVLLRTNIVIPAQGSRPSREGLLILTCEPSVRRVRFQIGDVTRSPSIRPSSHGRAIVRGWLHDREAPSVPIYPSVDFFGDGSFEFRETAGFGDSTMRGILGLLRNIPTRLEVVLFKGAETRAFQVGTAIQFKMHDLENSLGNIYGFEGLCFRP